MGMALAAEDDRRFNDIANASPAVVETGVLPKLSTRAPTSTPGNREGIFASYMTHQYATVVQSIRLPDVASDIMPDIIDCGQSWDADASGVSTWVFSNGSSNNDSGWFGYLTDQRF